VIPGTHRLARRHRGCRRSDRRNAGYVMFMLAISMVVLFSACAFALDLGSFYARASRIQRSEGAALQ
jgi:hypothetical protein